MASYSHDQYRAPFTGRTTKCLIKMVCVNIPKIKEREGEVMDSVSIAEHTMMYAKAYGIYFIVVGVALLATPSRFRSWYEDILSESRRVMFGGTISLLIGCFIVATHHHVVMDWPIIITLIGYWGVVSGAGSLISDKFIHLFKPMIHASEMVYRLSGVAWAILGVFLAFKGFGL